MTKLTKEALQKFVEAAQTRATMAAIGEAAGIKIAAVFNWLSRSKLAEAANDKDSIFWMPFEPFGYDWMHKHFMRCKNFFDLCVDGYAMELVSGLASEISYGPQDGRPLQALNPKFLHRDDQWFTDNGLDPAVDKYLWIRDDLTDEIIAPVYQRREIKPPAQLLIRALAAKLPQTWSESTNTNVNVSGQVVHRTEPARFISRNAPQGEDAIVEAEYTALPPERQDIAELRKAAAKLLANPDRPSSTPTAKVDLGVPKDELAPTSEYEGGERHAHDPQVLSTKQPQPERPSYARRTKVDSERTSPRGGNLDRSITK